MGNLFNGSFGGIQVLYLSVEHILAKIVQIDHELAGNCNYNVK
jgi:hypothetical protein